MWKEGLKIYYMSLANKLKKKQQREILATLAQSWIMESHSDACANQDSLIP